MDKEQAIAKRFNCTNRERAIFEAGIKLGAICHQFTGTPISAKNVKSVESAMKNTLVGLPYVRTAKVKIDHEFNDDDSEFSQIPLTEDMMDIIVVVGVGDSEVTAEMRYDKGLYYPLMYISKIY